MPIVPARPLVSVIIPTYDTARFLDEAVASVLGSSYPETEIIVVDDGSGDPEALRVLENFRRPRTRVVRIPHAGPAGARNHGISLARGEYILPLDDDDKVHPDYIAKAVKVLEGEPKVGIVYCRVRFFGARQDEWHLAPYSLAAMLGDNLIFTSALFRRRDWERVGGYNPNMLYGMEDYDFWLSLLDRTGCDVHRINEVLFYYRVRDHSRTTLMAERGQEAEMFARIFSNHQDLFLREGNLLRVYEHRVDLVKQLRKLESMIYTSPALKLERRLEKHPLLRAGYRWVFRVMLWLLYHWRRLTGGWPR